MARTPKYIEQLGGNVSTRHRSGKQEKRLAKELKGRSMLNSGATFSQNDVVTQDLEIEAKTTTKDSFSLKMKDWEKLHKKTAAGKMPVMIIQFEHHNKEFAVIPFDDLKFILHVGRNKKG